MQIPESLVRAAVETEEALDRLKLAYKERFNRFGPAHIVPYRGYGRSDLLVLRGRVLEAEEVGFTPEPGIWTNVRNTIRRLETDEIRGARVRAWFGEVEQEVDADDEAFFEVRLEPRDPVGPGWHRIRLEVVESMAGDDVGPVTGEVRVPPDEADFFIISDLDDTVLRTGATHRFSMLRTVLLNDAHTRLPFDGVVPLYRALAAGPSGDGDNPFFYLSRSAWNLYGMLEGFIEHHGLPTGPLLLNDYGLAEVLGKDEEPHKRLLIDHLMDFYPDRSFLFIGDSGQHDPEVYRDIALERPDRVLAVIIRDVTVPERDREVRAIAEEVEGAGVSMVLARDSAEAARAAADAGLVHGDAVHEVEAERKSEASAPSLVRRLLRGSVERDPGKGG